MYYKISVGLIALLLQACSSTPAEKYALQTADETSDDTVSVICHREKKLGTHMAEVVCRDVDGIAAEGELTRALLQKTQLKGPGSKQF